MARLTTVRRALTLFLPLIAAACGGPSPPPIDSGPTFDAPWSPSCIEAMDHSDFDWINTNIFNKSCANFTSCHQGNNPAGHLNMTTSKSYDELFNVPSFYFDGPPQPWVLVKPCSPEESYLLVRLRCYSPDDEFGTSCEQGPLDGGSLMPPNSRPICGPKVEAIRRWIMNGAPEVGTDNGCIPDGGMPDAAAPDAAPIDAPVADAGIPDGAP